MNNSTELSRDIDGQIKFWQLSVEKLNQILAEMQKLKEYRDK